MITSRRDLKVWQEAMKLAEKTYRLSASLPRSKARGLAEQMSRCVVSVPSNIAEGYGRESARAYIEFLKIARGSLNELETQILIAERVELASQEQTGPLLSIIGSVGRMLNGLIRSLRARQAADRIPA